MSATSRLMKEEVDAEDIAEAVAKTTGIPVSKMLQSEKEKLLNLEDELHKRVVGQDEAITRGSGCYPAEPGGTAGSQAADRILYFPWDDGCG